MPGYYQFPCPSRDSPVVYPACTSGGQRYPAVRLRSLAGWLASAWDSQTSAVEIERKQALAYSGEGGLSSISQPMSRPSRKTGKRNWSQTFHAAYKEACSPFCAQPRRAARVPAAAQSGVRVGSSTYTPSLTAQSCRLSSLPCSAARMITLPASNTCNCIYPGFLGFVLHLVRSDDAASQDDAPACQEPLMT